MEKIHASFIGTLFWRFGIFHSFWLEAFRVWCFFSIKHGYADGLRIKKRNL